MSNGSTGRKYLDAIRQLKIEGRLEQCSKQEVRAFIQFSELEVGARCEHSSTYWKTMKTVRWIDSIRQGGVNNFELSEWEPDSARSGRTTTARAVADKTHVKHEILEDRQVSVNELTHNLSLSGGTVSRMILQTEFYKVCPQVRLCIPKSKSSAWNGGILASQEAENSCSCHLLVKCAYLVLWSVSRVFFFFWSFSWIGKQQLLLLCAVQHWNIYKLP